MAAVFSAVALAAIAFALCFVFMCRRRRRQARLSFESAHVSNDPFRRDNMLPAMIQSGYLRTSYVDDPSRRLVSPSLGSNIQRSSSTSSYASGPVSGHGHTIRAATGAGIDATYEGPFSDYHADLPGHHSKNSNAAVDMFPDRENPFSDLLPEPPTAYLVDTSDVPHARRRPPSAESSPSIYPSSLPPVPEENTIATAFYEEQTKRPLRVLPPLPSIPPPMPPAQLDGRYDDVAHNQRDAERDETGYGDPFASPLDVVFETRGWSDRRNKGKGKASAGVVVRQPSSPADSQFSHNTSTLR